jgi:universal stress protein E
MSRTDKILLITDSEMRRSAALQRAAALASGTGASLHLCLVDYRPTLAGLKYADASVMKVMVDIYMKTRLDWLQSERAALASAGIRAECSAVWGRPAEDMILAKVQELKPSLLVKDVQSVPALARLFFTPLDWELLRLCPVPVMLVNPQSERLPKRIIATVDPVEAGRGAAELNDRVLQSARELASQCGAALHVVYVFTFDSPPVEGVAGVPVTAYARVRQELRTAHHKAFKRLMDSHKVPEDRRHFIEGPSTEAVIGDFASQHRTDLVVMGTVYRSAIDRFIFGSTAERTLSRLNCDVLALKSKPLMNGLRKRSTGLEPGTNYAS